MGSFLFSSDDIDKKVNSLSGGEKTRLALCQLLLSPSNFLILDEPTNHLDILSKNVLKQALMNYEGTFIVVSHDRDFLDGLTNRIWDISERKIRIHHFNLSEYLKLIDIKPTEGKPTANKKEKTKKTISNDRSAHKLQKEIEKIERKVSNTEKHIKSIEDAITASQSDPNMDKTSLYESIEEENKKLESLLNLWESKNYELELLTNTK